MSILGLEFRVTPKHFHGGDMNLKCLAIIATIYWKSIEGDKPEKAPVLESRPSTTRAHRVKGKLCQVNIYNNS